MEWWWHLLYLRTGWYRSGDLLIFPTAGKMHFNINGTRKEMVCRGKTADAGSGSPMGPEKRSSCQAASCALPNAPGSGAPPMLAAASAAAADGAGEGRPEAGEEAATALALAAAACRFAAQPAAAVAAPAAAAEVR